jgi:apolipoprotein D and lipocalin family protein
MNTFCLMHIMDYLIVRIVNRDIDRPMRHEHRYLFALLGLYFWMASSVQAQASSSALPTVSNVVLDRYAGRWYEVARLPMWFERKCIGDVSATYTVRADQRIDVLNRCRTETGVISAQGIAEIPDPAYPGQLRVRFAPDWLSWLPVVWGDYWIIDLDPQYRWVLVGAPSRDYLWILSRTPRLDVQVVTALKQKAATLGFSVDTMIAVENTETE